MIDETAIAGHEELIAPSEEVENSPEATTGQTTGTEETGPADDAGEATEEPVKRVPWFQKRIDEVTAQKYEHQREAAYWRGIAEGRTPQQPPQAQQQVAPDRWEDPDGYDRWLVQQAAQYARSEAAAELQQQHKHRTYEERENAVRQAKPDFDNIVRNPTLPISPLMAEVIRESEKGPEIAYWLGTNLEEAQRIAGLPLPLQAAAVGRIEAGFAGAPRTPTRNPPPAPPQTVNGISSGTGKSLEDMSMAEYVANMKAEGRL